MNHGLTESPLEPEELTDGGNYPFIKLGLLLLLEQSFSNFIVPRNLTREKGNIRPFPA